MAGYLLVEVLWLASCVISQELACHLALELRHLSDWDMDDFLFYFFYLVSFSSPGSFHDIYLTCYLHEVDVSICQTVFRLNSQASESHPLFYFSMLSLPTNAIIQ